MRSAISTVVSVALAISVLTFGASRAAAAEYRPVIFIPGLMGSTLKNDRGEVVWGTLKDTTSRFEQLAYPVDPKADKIASNGVLESLSLYLGWVKILAYAPMTEFLKREVGDKYTAFHYDWRQSNFDSACDLVRFIEARPSLADAARSDLGITVVTHSMGGIVGRIFIDYRAPAGTPAGAGNPCPHQFNVTLFAPIAAPFTGAGQALKSFTDKVATYWRFVRWNENEVLRVFFTIPSVYELLPRYGVCCIETRTGTPVDILSHETWRKNRWLPRELWGFRPAQIEPFVRARLNAAKRLQAIVAKPLPAETRLLSLWGYNQQTTTFVALKPAAPGKKPEADWSAFKDGDDTVPELSASRRCEPPATRRAEPCNDVPDLVRDGLKMWAFPNTHLGLMDDPKVREALSWGLQKFGSVVAGPRSLPEDVTETDVPEGLRAFVLSGATARSIEDAGLAKATFDYPNQLLQSDADQVVLFMATGPDEKPMARAEADKIRVSVAAGDGTKIPARIAVMFKPGQFGVAFHTPAGPDAVRVSIEMPGTAAVTPRVEGIFGVANGS